MPPEPPGRFADRFEAGRLLAERVALLGPREPVVLGLPRGGIPIAGEIAARLGVSAEAFVARKIGAPGYPEYGLAAIAEGLDEVVPGPQAARLGFAGARLAALAAAERVELERRVAAYRGDRPLPRLLGREVVLADDGLATGVTARAALRSLRRRSPSRLIFAAPVCAPESVRHLAESGLADDVVYVLAPADFEAVGEWYDDFAQLSDADVIRLLRPGDAQD
ncbi:MAG TPA: phosphoribosyltransferase family protein [Actinospica sp.]|nr:phosphoribosyltransferase family protein [Actinospica sp.]